MSPKASGPDSSEALVLTVVFSVLVSLVLGMVAYLGFAEAASQEARLKDSEARRALLQQDRDFLRYQTLVLTNAVGGFHVSDDDQEALQALGIQFEQNRLGRPGANRDEVVKRIAIVNQETDFDPDRKLAKNPYHLQVRLLRTQLQEAGEKRAKLEEELKKQIAALERELMITRARVEAVRKARQ